MPRICLSMIVKDEAPVIERCLESVAPLIDHWVIVDTGSSDGTQGIIRSFFARRGIAGALHERPWRDFATNRTEALALARPHADYSLIIDADDAIEAPAGFAWPELTADAYALAISDVSVSYERTQLVRNAMPWVYRGVLHEFLTCEGAGPVRRLDGLVMRRNHDGARRLDPLTYVKDAQMLEDALLGETDPMLVARYTYYLGQSYRDSGDPVKAADAYGRRVELGGWDEERWSAQLNRARCLLAAGDGAGFIEAATSAFAMRSQRAEPLLDLARYLRHEGEYEQAMVSCELAAHIKRPKEDRLFVEEAAYSFGIKQEMSISGYYCTEQKHKDLGRFASNDLALDRQAPPNVRGLARLNLAFYARFPGDLLPSWNARQLDWQAPAGWHVMNPSIAAIDGSHYVIARTVNFDISNGLDYIVEDGGPVRTRNYLVRLDAGLAPLSTTEIMLPPNLPEPKFGLVRGFEDLRLIGWRGELWCAATAREFTVHGWYEMVLARIALGDDGTAVLTDWRVLGTDGERRHEKNWMPRIKASRLEFIYSSDPTRIVDDRGQTISETVPDAALDNLRGGTQAIAFEDGWLAMTHEVVLIDGKRVYLHRFVWYDADDHVRRITEPFVFTGRGLEFAAGLCWRDEQTLIVSFGARDSEAWLATVSADDVRAAMAPSQRVGL